MGVGETQKRLYSHELLTGGVFSTDSFHQLLFNQLHRYVSPLSFNCLGFWGFQWSGFGMQHSLRSLCIIKSVSFIK